MDKISITEAQSLLNAADEAMVDFEHKRERKAIFGDRLTTTIKLPPDGEFREYSDEEQKELQSFDYASEKEIYCRLQAYEDTGLTPEEITDLIADNKRLHELINSIEDTIKAL